LRILTCFGLRLCHGSDGGAIDAPDNLIRGPVNAVGVKLVVISWSAMESASVVASGCLSFSKIIALGLGIVPTKPLPINLIQAVRL
jgi:hypothetical protein